MDPLLAETLCRSMMVESNLENCRIVLVDLNRLSHLLDGGNEEQRLRSFLSAQEQQIFSGFSYPKRRVEWLGGRLAAKCALVYLLGEPALLSVNTVSIIPALNGKPVLTSSSASCEAVRLSISHSVDYAAAMVSKNICGIDIQCCSTRLHKVQERFAVASELVLLSDEQDHLTRLAMLWTAKEATKKCFYADDPTFFGQLCLVKAEKHNERQWRLRCRLEQQDSPEARVDVVLFDQYSLASVQGTEHA
ncbi:MAG: 4'-phosphopantetheinyl transferase superfamily protein [Desulfobulbus sp.]|nr:4'-phosphopantetheinyl transferase superfamily protein [Desulfobulbus sp.]